MVKLRAGGLHRIQRHKALPIERLPLAYLVLDRDLRVNEWNPAAENIFGYSKKEVLGKNCLDFLLPTPISDCIRDIVRRIWNGDLNAHSVNDNLTKDGRTITCEWSNTPMWDPTGKVTSVICLGRDITAARRAEQMLKRSENAMREYADRLHQLSRRVVQIQEQERQHLARELHDEIGQVLSAIRVNLGANLEARTSVTKPDIEESISIVDKAIHQVRDLALDLRPSMLDDLGLIATLRWTAERQAKRAKFHLDFTAEATGDCLPADLNIAIYRVAQESLTNIVRHAHANRVSLVFRHHAEEIELEICDDGVGFDTNEVQRRMRSGASFGISGMRERVELLGGTFAITSSPGNGSTIHAHLPIECGKMVIAQ